jgi:hypothetical protein
MLVFRVYSKSYEDNLSVKQDGHLTVVYNLYN